MSQNKISGGFGKRLQLAIGHRNNTVTCSVFKIVDIITQHQQLVKNLGLIQQFKLKFTNVFVIESKVKKSKNSYKIIGNEICVLKPVKNNKEN